MIAATIVVSANLDVFRGANKQYGTNSKEKNIENV